VNIDLQLPAVLTFFAVFAWCVRRARLPDMLKIVNKLSMYRTTKDDLKTLDKRLEALQIPVNAEIFAAARTILTFLPAVTGLLMIINGSSMGFVLMCSIFFVFKLPESFLAFREKQRKEEILKDFPLMIDQIRIYAEAAGYYQALKIVSGSMVRGTLGRELAVLSAELELSGFSDALDNFARRCGINEISDFTRIILVENNTGAEISRVLENYSLTARQNRVSKIKRKIKLQPVIMSVLPALLMIIFILMFIIPMVGSIIRQLNAI